MESGVCAVALVVEGVDILHEPLVLRGPPETGREADTLLAPLSLSA